MAANPFSPFGKMRGKGKKSRSETKKIVKNLINSYSKGKSKAQSLLRKEKQPAYLKSRFPSGKGEEPKIDEYGNVIDRNNERQTLLDRMEELYEKEGENKYNDFNPAAKNKENLPGIKDEELEELIYGRKNIKETLSQKEEKIKEQEKEIKEREKEVKGAKERAKLKLQQFKLKAKRQGIKALRKGVAALPEGKKIEATDIDFIIILIFAIIVDSTDSILTIIQMITAFTIGEVMSAIIDIIATALISLWMFSRLKEIAQSKKARVAQLQKKMGKEAVSMQKELARIQAKAMRAPVRRIILRVGAGLILELIPFVGLIPWWTITVASTLREK